jgi:hypothetical protein
VPGPRIAFVLRSRGRRSPDVLHVLEQLQPRIGQSKPISFIPVASGPSSLAPTSLGHRSVCFRFLRPCRENVLAAASVPHLSKRTRITSFGPGSGRSSAAADRAPVKALVRSGGTTPSSRTASTQSTMRRRRWSSATDGTGLEFRRMPGRVVGRDPCRRSRAASLAGQQFA